jgi:hypothetical protein
MYIFDAVMLSLAHVYWASSWLVSEYTESNRVQGIQSTTEFTTEAKL